jgi:BioD-like phosphotransacetylase family protein
MKLKKPIPEKQPVQTALYDALRKFLGASKELMTVLQQNPVISSDELKEAGRKLVDVKHIIAGVLNRTVKLKPIVENSELYSASDIELATKLESQEQEVSYLVSIASTMLDKLRQKQHITDKEHDTLMRYWMSLSEQHQRLIDRWETARNT